MSARQRRQRCRAEQSTAEAGKGEADDTAPLRRRRAQQQQHQHQQPGPGGCGSNQDDTEQGGADTDAAASTSRAAQRLRQLSARSRGPVAADGGAASSRGTGAATTAPGSPDEVMPRSLLPRATDLSAVMRAAVATRRLWRKSPGPDAETLPPFDKAGLVEGGADALQKLSGQACHGCPCCNTVPPLFAAHTHVPLRLLR